MANYKFEWLNGGAEIINPTITINPDNISIFPSNMTIDVDILLTTPNGTSFGVRLFDIPVENLNYDVGTLQTRVLSKLENFKV